MSRNNANAGNGRAGQPGPSRGAKDLAESIQAAVSGAVSTALAPVLQGLQANKRSSLTSGFASDEEDFIPEPVTKKRYVPPGAS